MAGETLPVMLRGLQRSGTNYAQQWLFGQHFPRIKIETQNKHREYDRFGNGADRLFVIVKNPMAWAVSVWRWGSRSANGPHGLKLDWMPEPWHGGSFADFVNRYRPGRAWSLRNRSWLEVDCFTKLVLRYEWTLESPGMAVERVAQWLEREPSKGAVGFAQYRYQLADSYFDPLYYYEERWRDEYDPLTWIRMESSLDRIIVDTVGFEVSR